MTAPTPELSVIIQEVTFKRHISNRLLHSEKLSIIIDEESKIFHDKNRLKACMTTIEALQRLLKGIF